MRYWSIGGLEYEVPQSRLYCLCINVALWSTALQCICRVIRRSSMTMKTHILHNFWTSTHRGEASPPPPGGATALVQPMDGAGGIMLEGCLSVCVPMRMCVLGRKHSQPACRRLLVYLFGYYCFYLANYVLICLHYVLQIAAVDRVRLLRKVLYILGSSSTTLRVPRTVSGRSDCRTS